MEPDVYMDNGWADRDVQLEQGVAELLRLIATPQSQSRNGQVARVKLSPARTSP